jgi:hypothetical protein
MVHLSPEIPIGATVPMKLVRRSVCSCGYPVVQDFTPDGKVYDIEAWTALPYQMKCGGCGAILQVTVAFVIEEKRRIGKMVIDVMEPVPC